MTEKPEGGRRILHREIEFHPVIVFRFQDEISLHGMVFPAVLVHEQQPGIPEPVQPFSAKAELTYGEMAAVVEQAKEAATDMSRASLLSPGPIAERFDMCARAFMGALDEAGLLF